MLKNGKDSYLNQSSEVLRILKEIDAMPVQRNKGIDGFLRVNDSTKPIPIKIQRFDETLEKAQQLLVRASSKNGFKKKILIKTHNFHEVTLLDVHESSKDVLVIASVKDFVKNKAKMILSF